MCGPLECIFCELCLPQTCTPSGGRNSEMRRRRGLARVASCSPVPYASFEWMCGPLECIFCELCLPLTCTPSGGRNSEIRRHRGLARVASCSPKNAYGTGEHDATRASPLRRRIPELRLPQGVQVSGRHNSQNIHSRGPHIHSKDAYGSGEHDERAGSGRIVFP